MRVHRVRLCWVIPFALAAIGMLVVAPAANANNPNILNGCKTSTTAGAEMGHYPAWPGSQSYLRVACIFSHGPSATGAPNDFVSPTFTIHDFANAVYHNGAARTMTANMPAPPGAMSFSVADCTSATGFVNRTISGPGIAPRTFVTSITAACVLNLNIPTVPPGIAVGDTFLVENSSVRSVNTATVQPIPTMNVCDPTFNFTAADVGLSVDGTLIVPGSMITGLGAAGCVDLSTPPTGALGGQVITIGRTLDGSVLPITGVSTTRTVNDGVVAAGPPNTITSAVARFFSSDIGLKVSGAGIVQPCYIASRTNTVATLSSSCAPANVGPYTFTIGDPSRTAPLPTDTVLNWGFQLPLDPTLVPGAQPCSTDNAIGAGIEGSWLNPGSFVGGIGATQPPSTKAIGEILFTTPVVQFGAFVLEIPAAPIGTDPLIGAYHFNVVFPNVPTGMALCPSTPTSPGLGFSIGVNATTLSQGAIPTGAGRPGTAQLRSTRGTSGIGATSTVFITDDVNGAGIKWVGPNFNRLCSIPATTPDINFVCGDG